MSLDQAAQAATGWRFALATDLDGTFLGGTEADRRNLYARIGAHRRAMGLIFVTGRDPEFIEGLCADGFVPWPDFVVGDVGTTIAAIIDRRVTPIAELEADIAALWADRGAEVRRRLHGLAGLRLQPTPFRHRVSYDYDPLFYDGAGARIVAEMGLDHLISANTYFDVLPPGVSKGPSLVRLIDWLGLPRDAVLVAGDTLNDFSMFETGMPGVAVGGSEPALLARVADKSHVHKAQAHGAAGIAEAIARFGFPPLASGDPR
ncbi:MAG: HAD family hydrolase [Rubrimonas sp.]|uniref:HAD family hydrolase n=1 Tax=Rubrimonas sp. TaxID=2036015 RepID=UPI002FDEC4C4